MLWFCCPAAPPSVRLDFGLGSGVDGIMRLVLKSLEALVVLLFFFYMVMISMTGQKRQPTTWWCRLKKTHLCVCVHPSVGHITRCRTTSSWQRLVVIMMELHIMMNMKRRRTTTTCCHKFKIMPRCNWVGRRCSTSLLSTSEIIMMLWNNVRIDRRTDEQTNRHPATRRTFADTENAFYVHFLNVCFKAKHTHTHTLEKSVSYDTIIILKCS